MEELVYRPIGVVHSPFKTAEGAPIQPVSGKDAQATVEVFPPFMEGLSDIDGFSHLILLYHCHRSKPFSLKVRPFLDDTERGLFSTRAPSRPNPIGLSVVRLEGREEGVLRVREVDIVDGSPVLDIKPYVPEFDVRRAERTGWFEGRGGEGIEDKKADDRFSR